MAYNDERVGINIVIRQFNGLQELSRRQDGIRELVKKYENYPVLSQVQKDANSKNYHVPYKLPYLELVLSDSTFLNKMTNTELEVLRKIAVTKYADKLQNYNVYKLFNVKKTMLLFAVVMNKQHQTENSKQDIIRTFIQNYNSLDANILGKMSKIIKE